MTLSRRASILGAPLLVVAIAFGVVFAQTAEAAWPRGNGKIVFYKVNFAAFTAQIYSINSEGKQTDLSAAGGGASEFDFQPSVSPDGKRIVFTRRAILDPTTFAVAAQLWTMNIDGSHQTDISKNPLVASESGSSWTEDGSGPKR